MILISIITVVYNGEASLEATIKSVIETISNNKQFRFEYYIIDGGSKDSTVSIIKRHSAYITSWISEPDKGIYDAMNKGWTLVKPESYILYLGAGDRLLSLPTSLDKNYSSAYYGSVYIGDELFRSVCNYKLKLGNTLHHQALLIPKIFHPQPPFDLNYAVYADFDFNQRLLKKQFKFVKTEELIAYALPGGISAERDELEMRNIVRKNFGLFFSTLAAIYYWLQKYVKS